MCKQYEPSLWDYYDDQLTGEAKRQVEAHLPTCSSCSSDLSQWKAIAQKTFVRQATVSPYLATRVMAEIERREAAQQSPAWAWGWDVGFVRAFALGAVLLSTIGGAYFLKQADNQVISWQDVVSPEDTSTYLGLTLADSSALNDDTVAEWLTEKRA